VNIFEIQRGSRPEESPLRRFVRTNFSFAGIPLGAPSSSSASGKHGSGKGYHRNAGLEPGAPGEELLLHAAILLDSSLRSE
jgi:hypothetical protein